MTIKHATSKIKRSTTTANADDNNNTIQSSVKQYPPIALAFPQTEANVDNAITWFNKVFIPKLKDLEVLCDPQIPFLVKDDITTVGCWDAVMAKKDWDHVATNFQKCFCDSVNTSKWFKSSKNVLYSFYKKGELPKQAISAFRLKKEHVHANDQGKFSTQD
jgi:hypothetical protein